MCSERLDTPFFAGSRGRTNAASKDLLKRVNGDKPRRQLPIVIVEIKKKKKIKSTS